MKIGNGKEILVWYDKQCTIGPFSKFITRRDLYDARFDANATVEDMVRDNQWIWNTEQRSRFPAICNIPVPMFTNDRDEATWKDKNGNLKKFSVKQVWEDYKESEPEVKWKNLVWYSQYIPSHSFIPWMAILARLQTQDRIFQRNNDQNMKCSLCNECIDSHDHIFFQCSYVKSVQELIKIKSYVQSLSQSWMNNVEAMTINNNNTIKSVVRRLVFGSMVYFVWQERNIRQFTSEKRNHQCLADIMLELSN